MRNRPWLVFAVFFAWKLALFLLAAQPVPANDAFFYDGAVVNYLLHSGYFNPAIVALFPICGGQLFGAYPPLYQAVLLGWMSLFGTSVFSAMALHLALIGLGALLLYGVLRKLQTPVWCLHFAGAWLFLLTFHDRPDTLAQVLGLLSVYAWTRSRLLFNAVPADAPAKPSPLWTWLMAAAVVLCLATSLQIGGTYFMLALLGTTAAVYARHERFPFGPMLMMILTPPVLVMLVKTQFPLAWAGFQENVNLNPSFLTGWHAPTLLSILKALRTVPGVLFVTGLLLWCGIRRPGRLVSVLWTGPGLVLTLSLLASLGVTAVSLAMFAPELIVNMVNYLQPLVVADKLALASNLFPETHSGRWLRAQTAGLMLLLLLGCVRGIGMSTWGLACARDVSSSAALHRVDDELERQPAHSAAVLSSAYLYEAARQTNVALIHSDYVRSSLRSTDTEGVLERKPVLLILTQYDYYRRFETVVSDLKSNPQVRGVRVENTARIRAPDSYPQLRQVIQHIAWAPVIIDIAWK